MSSKINHQYGSIRTPADLLVIEGYEEVVDFSKESGRRLLEMLDEYEFAKIDEYPCGIKGCRTAHQFGYLVVSDDGKVTNIGRICGKRHLNLDFTRVKKAYREKRKAADNLASITSIREEFSAYQARLDRVKYLSKSLAECREILREKLLTQSIRLTEMSQKGSNQIIRTRRMDKREAQIHFLRTGTSRKDYEGGRPMIEEPVARLDGCSFFRQSLGLFLKKQILPPIEQLLSMTGEQISSMSPKDLENTSRNVNNALRLISSAESMVDHGLKFFAQENLQKLLLMDAPQENLDKVIAQAVKLSEDSIKWPALP